MTPHEKREQLIHSLATLVKAVEQVEDKVAGLEGKSAEMATLRSARIEDLEQLRNDIAGWLAVVRESHVFLTHHESEKKN